MKNFKMPKMPGFFGQEQDSKNPAIVGAGRLAGGKFETLSISGSGEVDGDVEATEISVSGSGQIAGDIKAGAVKASGSLDVRGSVRAGEFSSSGSSGIAGDLTADSVTWSGSGSVGGSVKAGEFTSRGAFRIDEKLDADTIDVELNGDSSAGSIQGTTITVKRGQGTFVRGKSSSGGRGGSVSSNIAIGSISVGGKSSGSSFTYVSHGSSGKASGGSSGDNDSRLEADSIRGDTIELENTDAKTVQGKDITIGEGCKIDTVTYSGELTVHENASVKKRVKA